MKTSLARSAARCRPAPKVPHHHWWSCLFDLSEDAQVVCRDSGMIVEANRKARQLLGLAGTERESEWTNMFELLTSNTAARLAELLGRALGRQETLPAVSLISEGRLSLLADLQITPLGDAYSLVAIKDASRRWRLESHVQRLMTAVDATSDVIFLTDSEFRIAFVNAAFQTETGYSIEEALGRPADFLRAPASQGCIREYLDSVAQGRDWHGELCNVRSDGVTYPVEATISPIFERQGHFFGYVAFEKNVSARQRLQDELRLERNLVLSTINSLDAAVYTVDRQFRFNHINDGWKKMPAHHGWLDMTQPPRAGEMILDRVSDLAKRAELRALFEAVLAGGETQELSALQPDGHYWSVKLVPWRHEGVLQGLLYVVTDQTRFHELQSQLYQAQKMEIIGTLAAGVAHDFNNLLQAIRGNVGLLLMEDSLAPLSRHQAQQIEQAAVRAADISQQLLAFSRVSDEKLTVLDFNQAIQEASHMAQRSLMSHVVVELQPAPQSAKVRIDPTRAQQLLLNLCVNAQDAMPQGGRLTLRNTLIKLTEEQAAQSRFPAGTDFLRCTVADTGSGIPPEVLKHVFEPFFTTKDKDKGTGLGLAIVQGVVKQAQGFVEVQTVVGEGTAFHLYFPLAQAGLTGKSKTASRRLSQGTGRVLVVDDLDLVLDFTRTFLRTAGYEVLVASSGEEALVILSQQVAPVDLVFTDYNMAGINGRQLIDEIMQRWPGRKVKFILASGYLEDHERQQLEQDTRIRILDKPFNMREAAELIAEMLTPASAISGSPPQN